MFGQSKIPTLKVPKAPIAKPEGADTPPASASGSAAGGPAAPRPGAKPKKPVAKGGSSADSKDEKRAEEFYGLKTRIHRKLVEALDLAALGKRNDDEVKEEVKEVIVSLCDSENALLNFNEKQRLVTEILNETFGLGPLEVLLSDPQDRKSTRLNSSHTDISRMPSSA